MLLYQEFQHDFDLYDACSDSYGVDGEYYDNISEFIAPKYGLEL